MKTTIKFSLIIATAFFFLACNADNKKQPKNLALNKTTKTTNPIKKNNKQYIKVALFVVVFFIVLFGLV